jgi:small subunit ribosomal protein S4
MTNIIAAKHKISRSLGVDLWGSHKFKKDRSYPPGEHGPNSVSRRKTDYGVHLIAKQKLRCYYNMKEGQFSTLYKEAKRLKGDTSENLIGLLESRLATVIYRANFAPTIFAAKQFVSHGHVEVNGNRVNVSSYQVKVGDVVSIRKASQELLIVLETIQKKERDIPVYMEVNLKTKQVKLLSIPALEDVPYACIMDPNLVVEYYSA